MNVARPTPRAEAANTFVRRLVLVLTLVMSCVLGLITPYLLAVIGVVVLAFTVVRGTYLDTLRSDRAAQLFLAVFLALGACFAITAEAPADMVYLLNFVMLVLYVPFAALLRTGANAGTVARVADLALAGTLVAFLAAVAGLYFLGWNRAESPIFGAILLANTALLLSFLSLMGIATGSPRRWAYLVAPVLGIAVVAMTGSRGPLLALVPLTLLAAWFTWRTLRLKPLFLVLGVAAYLSVSALVVVALDSRSSTIFAAIGQVLDDPMKDLATSTEAPSTAPSGPDVVEDAPPAAVPPTADFTTNIRLALYEAGIRAFLDRSVFGHGWARLMSAPEPYLAPEYRPFAEELPQLHNDIINFAVAAGSVGVLLYFVLLLTPLVAWLALPPTRRSLPQLYGILVLTGAYFCDGLTDLMFGFEFHTAFFVVVSAILLAYCRDADGAAHQ